jgi:hypothetical protein
VLELENNLNQSFLQKNKWLANFLNAYPWSNDPTAHKIKPNYFFPNLRRPAEWLLGGRIGDLIEKALGSWQKKRIRQKTKDEPTDQIYVSDYCLMFHPQSKSYQLLKNFNQKIDQINQ